MKVTDMTNLFVAYSEEADIRLLICADDKEDAMETAKQFGADSYLYNDWKISGFYNTNTKFDCDRVITLHDTD